MYIILQYLYCCSTIVYMIHISCYKLPNRVGEFESAGSHVEGDAITALRTRVAVPKAELDIDPARGVSVLV